MPQHKYLSLEKGKRDNKMEISSQNQKDRKDRLTGVDRPEADRQWHGDWEKGRTAW